VPLAAINGEPVPVAGGRHNLASIQRRAFKYYAMHLGTLRNWVRVHTRGAAEQ